MDERSGQLPLASKVVLVCEDSAIIALDCETLLLELGARSVHIAATISEARALIDAGLDLAILDVNLGGENTLAIADELRLKKTPFIFMSGYFGVREMAEKFGGTPAIAKPYSQKDLAEACRAALDAARR